jgi:hypothetical protein
MFSAAERAPVSKSLQVSIAYSITHFLFPFNEENGFFIFKMVKLRSFISHKGEGVMGKKEDTTSISEKAKGYFAQGFN